MAEKPFSERVLDLPRLGLGISTEFEAGRRGLDINGFAERRPDLVRFLEVGCDLDRGLDEDARAWARSGRPTTYHFLDLNLEEPEDLDPGWAEETRALASEIGAAWICGDAGLWHVGPRDRGHGLLMPPILVPESADVMADAVREVRRATGFEIVPENPPGHVYLGEMHLLDYFARMTERADCGLLLDVAHLAIYQRVTDREPLDGLDGLPLDRVVEMHVAAGTEFEHEGRVFVDDDHGVEILEDTWRIFDHVLERATNLKAVVYECERNREEEVLPTYERLAEAWA